MRIPRSRLGLLLTGNQPHLLGFGVSITGVRILGGFAGFSTQLLGFAHFSFSSADQGKVCSRRHKGSRENAGRCAHTLTQQACLV